TTAIAAGANATTHAPHNTMTFAQMRANDGIGCCSSIFAAPLCLSPATTRIATNGRRKTAATSHALNVGAQIPMRGENASPTPTAVPFSPLASAYVRTALMNVTPTSGPIATSSTHHDRDARSSRVSLRSNQRKATAEDAEIGEKKVFSAFSAFSAVKRSRERKEHLFEVAARRGAARGGERRQFRQRPLAASASAAQQHEAIADARGVADLVNRQEHRAPGRRVRAQRLRDLAALPQVEAVEGLIGEKQRLRHQQPDREQRALALPFRQVADCDVQDRRQLEALDHLVAKRQPAAEEAEREIDRPSHRLRRPRRDRIGKIEERAGTLANPQRTAVARQRARVERQHAAHALEQRRL